MYAIIETGGKQYRVEKGDVIDVELLEPLSGGQIAFNNVLFLSSDTSSSATPQVGTPYIPQGIVRGELMGEVKGPKEIAFSYKRRKGIRRKVGHRQRYTRVKITEISG